MAEPAPREVQRGVAALHAFLGPDVVQTWLTTITPRYYEAAAFTLPLPVDYTGISRRLRIGFPSNFPRSQLALQVTPSPWLQWPHAMEDGMCLHGFGERPITGTPESIVTDSLTRLGQILSFAVEGSDPDRRAAEFHAEITSYWSHQLKRSTQSLLLLNRPMQAGPLYAVNDPRHEVFSGWETLWLSNELSLLKKHHERVVGVGRSVRQPLAPAFYIKLQDYPPLGVPAAEAFFEWLTPCLDEADIPTLVDWLESSDSIPARWAVLELPGEQVGPLFCFNVRSKVLQPRRGPRYGLRAGRRQNTREDAALFPSVLQVATLDLLDRDAIHSRERSGVANELEHRRVVLVGLGSLGSPVAMQLAKAGVGQLTLIDPDRLVGQNLGRHALGMDDLGKSKAGALRMRLQRDLPTVHVEAYNTFIERVLTTKSEILDTADLVIVTSADWGSEEALWRAKAEGASWPLLQAWSEPHAFVGHALIALASADGRRLFNERGDFAHAFTTWPDGGVVPLPACGESFIPGGATGLADVVSMVVNSAVRILRGKTPEQAWVSSISTPDVVATLHGHYRGPSLGAGQVHVVLERDWPLSEEYA